MPASTGFADAIGTFIDAWDDGLVEAYKNVVPVLADAPLREGQLVGGKYHVATRLTYEGGTSFAPPQTQPGDTAATPYVGPRSGYSPDAQIEGMQIHGRSRLTYEAIARSSQSVSDTGENKKKAVNLLNELTTYVKTDMSQTCHKKENSGHYRIKSKIEAQAFANVLLHERDRHLKEIGSI